MKFLTLIRHASAVHDESFRDFDRPLKPRGIEKFRSNVGILNSRGYTPDIIVSSPAVRALQTAEIYAEESGQTATLEDLISIDKLYLPSPGDILDCVRAIDDDYADLFLFSHNNGISWVAQEFSGDRSIIMPTGSVVRIELDIGSWSKAAFGCGRKLDFIP